MKDLMSKDSSQIQLSKKAFIYVELNYRSSIFYFKNNFLILMIIYEVLTTNITDANSLTLLMLRLLLSKVQERKDF